MTWLFFFGSVVIFSAILFIFAKHIGKTVKSQIEKSDKDGIALRLYVDEEMDKAGVIKDNYLRINDHDAISEKERLEFKLYVSEVADRNLEFMIVAIDKNKDFVTNLFNVLRKDIKDNKNT